MVGSGISPSPDKISSSIPTVSSVPDSENRPFWSVMVPTYNCAHYLRRTLQSVLCQDPGPEKMQIEVVDDCSTRDDPATLVAELGKGRIHFHRKPRNEGVTAVFNTCLQRSRGQWVHILHGDDMVLPGMYQAYRRVIEATDPVMVMGRVITIDEWDNWLGIIGPDPQEGLIPDFVSRQAFSQLGQFAAVVGRRSAYEKIGGFCSIFGHVADWDMWFRMGQVGAVSTLPLPYGLYRIHAASDTNRLMVSGKNIEEAYGLLRLNLERLGMQRENRAAYHKAIISLGRCAEQNAWRLDEKRSTEGRFNQACWAWKLQPSWRRLLLLSTSWLKYRLFTHRASSPTTHFPPHAANAQELRKDETYRRDLHSLSSQTANPEICTDSLQARS